MRLEETLGEIAVHSDVKQPAVEDLRSVLGDAITLCGGEDRQALLVKEYSQKPE